MMKLQRVVGRVAAVGALLAAVASAAPPTPVQFPSYRQCDPAWGNDTMGVQGPGEQATICREGCAMTSLSMVFASLGAVIYDEVVNPGNLNAYFQRHGCYYCAAGDCNNLKLDCWALLDLTDRLAFGGEVPKPPLAQLVGNVTQGLAAVIAHVHDSGHFVLVTGWDERENAFAVHDPFYNSTHYPYANISDVILYSYLQPLRRPLVPLQYPLYKQCAQPWGPNVMEKRTVCEEGCLMSSTSMALAHNHIAVGGAVATPGTLNAWLRGNSGYVNGTDDLDEDAVRRVAPGRVAWDDAWSMHTTNDLPLDYILTRIKQGQPVIANVFRGGHFVLVVGWDEANPDALVVHDPGFTRTTWSYSNGVVGWRLFNMTAAESV